VQAGKAAGGEICDGVHGPLPRPGSDHDELVWKILDQSPYCITVLSLGGSIESMNRNG